MKKTKKVIIVDEYVEMTWSPRNKKNYVGKGYAFTKIGDVFRVKVKDLSDGSHIKVLVRCDVCGVDRFIEHRSIIEKGHTRCVKCVNSVKKNYRCVYCGESSARRFDNQSVCDRHYVQLKRKGYIYKRSISTPNEIVKLNDNYSEMFLYNLDCEVVKKVKLDNDMVDIVKEHKWSWNNTGNGIASTTMSGKKVQLNRFLAFSHNPLEEKRYVRFIDGDVANHTVNNLQWTNEKVTPAVALPLDEDNVLKLHNIKYESIGKNRYRLLNVRKTTGVSAIEKDIVVELDKNGCWNCVSHSKDRGGYVCVHAGENKQRLHRLVLELKIQRELTEEEVCRHKCDNPQCCNPNHLECGSHQDNVDDMIERGRAYYQKYKKEDKEVIIMGDSITTINDAELIYRKIVEEGVSQKDLCNQYGYTRGVVGNIVNKVTWVALTDKLDKTIVNKKDEDIKSLVEVVTNLSKENQYTNREIALLARSNRETVRNIKNGDLYGEYVKEHDNNESVIYVSNINHDTIVDGEGFRTSIYSSFCNHQCEMCHNKSQWDITAGEPITISQIFKEVVSNDETNVTFTGGDPMFQAKGFKKLAKRIKEETKKTIWVYSGYTFEQITSDPDKLELLKLCDVLVDGLFVEAKKDLTLRFRGSSNQRILDVKQSLKTNTATLYDL